jgi:thiol:disulfide interchange protein DsbA
MTSRRLALLLIALLPFAASAAPAATPAPVAGTDYEIIENGSAYAPVKGKVEVVEVFGYWCHFCAEFAPKIEAWKRKLPADVNLVLLPLPRGEGDPLASAFFAAQEAGALPRTHQATFRAIHEDHALPRNPTMDEIATFYAQFGLDPAKLSASMQSPSIAAKLMPARKYAIDSGVEGTPTIIVNGKYRVTGKNFDDTLRIADELIERERKTGKR